MAESVVNIHAEKPQLPQLVARAEKGEPIIIARAGKPAAQLVPAPKRRRRKLPIDDPLLRLDEWGFDGPVGKLSNADIGRVVYRI